MKYAVQLNDERYAVTIDGDGLRFGDEPVQAQLEEVEGTPVRIVRIGSEVHRVVTEKKPGRGRYALWIDGYRFDVEALDERTRAIRDLSAASKGPSGPAPVLAPMPGLIVRVNVKVGDVVEAGQGLVVMEAMKMENELRATTPGTVMSVLAVAGTAVEKGTVLVTLE